MTKFYTAVECPECDTEVRDLCGWMGEEEFPVVHLQIFACTGWICPNCGCEFGTGDLDLEVFKSGNGSEVPA